MGKATVNQLNSWAHSNAHSQLNRIIDSQQSLLANVTLHGDSGSHVGDFLNSLYDKLVELNRKNLEATQNED